MCGTVSSFIHLSPPEGVVWIVDQRSGVERTAGLLCVALSLPSPLTARVRRLDFGSVNWNRGQRGCCVWQHTVSSFTPHHTRVSFGFPISVKWNRGQQQLLYGTVSSFIHLSPPEGVVWIVDQRSGVEDSGCCVWHCLFLHPSPHTSASFGLWISELESRTAGLLCGSTLSLPSFTPHRTSASFGLWISELESRTAAAAVWHCLFLPSPLPTRGYRLDI